ncbi:(d)CMP kinase [Priestia filamentosa]|uniref:Cytidylate kinase n=1 Tax=Priestia filamentosa TaxID=1402861 RepID=A0A1X7D3I7_9BACI|nr:(d)CMP kinase [Priestia filamentosa]AKO93981.1 cytidylate kinase [Priestia filamentosa]MDT3764229.1 (d)CMP kinase [Priestia filamentosa]OXS71302.1 cytidylate kinase [Priestia filamentosa]RJS66943.1 (d)CMP kinase [Priestia filamentosa]WCM14857.1 (d)CMP kinase [Priestia filamentosa]
MEKHISIAIDGPAAAGKSTVAKIVATNLSYIYVDTGAMYRALTYEAQRTKVNLQNEQALIDLLYTLDITLKPSPQGQLIFINGEDVTEQIRTNEVTKEVSIVAKHGEVRKEMVDRQRKLAKGGGVVMDGRDIGTHVLPHAEVKVFLLASVEKRAYRRYEENKLKGFDSDLEQLKLDIAKRDKLDSEREVSPLRKAEDAVEIDTTSLTIEEVVAKILDLADERINVS